MASNYAPGVTGNEPQLTGIWPCVECGAALPEIPTCPSCGEPMEQQSVVDAGSGDWICLQGNCLGALPAEFDRCPGGCREPEWEPIEETSA